MFFKKKLFHTFLYKDLGNTAAKTQQLGFLSDRYSISWRRMCSMASTKFLNELYRVGLGIILKWAIFKNHSKIALGNQTSFLLFVYFKGLFQSPLAG